MNNQTILYHQLWTALAEERQKVREELKNRNLESALTEDYSKLFFYIRLNIGCYVAEISLNNDLRLQFYQQISDRYDRNTLYKIMPIKKYVPEFLFTIGKYNNGGFVLPLTSLTDFSTVIIKVVDFILGYQSSLMSFCEKSSNLNSDRSEKKKFKSWKTDATLCKISKEMPIQRMYQGISQQKQASYDNSPFLHGSDGTYVENVNPFWELKFKVKRLAYEVDSPQILTLDIHDYITKVLMPKLEWGKITENRLEQINNLIKDKTLKVVTFDMEEAPLYRKFVPEDYNNNWNAVMDDILSKLT